MRDANGQFVKGASGNAGGRPKGVRWFRAKCQERTDEALDALVAALKREEHSVAAAKVLLEFAWGKAPAVAEAEDNPGDTVPSVEEAAAAAERLRAAH